MHSTFGFVVLQIWHLISAFAFSNEHASHAHIDMTGARVPKQREFKCRFAPLIRTSRVIRSTGQLEVPTRSGRGREARIFTPVSKCMKPSGSRQRPPAVSSACFEIQLTFEHTAQAHTSSVNHFL
jgi:hypothetical protein